MKCPHCLEEIKDDAVVCQHCRRDLAFFRPISDRLWKLEHKVEIIRAAVSGLASGGAPTTDTQILTLDSAIVKIAIAIVSSVFLAFAFYWISWSPLNTSGIEDKALNFMSGFIPFFAAIGLGLAFPGLRRLTYAIIGWLAGFFGYIAMLLVFSTHNQGRLNPDPIVLFIAYTVAGVVGFLGGGAIGERLSGRKRQPNLGGLDEPLEASSRVPPETLRQIVSILQIIGTIASSIIAAKYAKP